MKAVLDNLDDLDESLHSEYVENPTDKKFYLKVEEIDSLPVVKKLKEENGARRIELKKVKTSLEAFGDLKPDEVREQLDRIPELEAAASGKIDETKIETIVQARIKKVVAPIERERDTFKTQVAEKDKEIEGFKTERVTRKIHDAVVKAATGSKMLDSAREDAIMLAERVFEVGEDGSVATKDNVGVTPGISPEVWLTEMQEKRPHWWGNSVGGGATGSRQNGGFNENPFTREHWNMTKQGEMVKANRTRAEQMAKAAGTTIGGGMPAAKK